MGRPKLDIDPRQVFRLAKLHATNVEIAEVLGCSVDTLTRRFADELTKGRCVRNVGLRRAQLRYALAGNATLLIWLGKQILGQSDKLEVADTTDERNTADPEAARRALEAASTTKPKLRIEP